MMKKRNPHQMPHDENQDQAGAAAQPGANAEAAASGQTAGQAARQEEGNGQASAGQTETAGQEGAASQQAGAAASDAASAAGNGATQDTAAGNGAESSEKSELAKAREDYRILTDRYLRLMAEYDNFRKRSQKEREALYLDSVAAVVKEWLPVIDNLDRAGQAAQTAEGESARRIADGVTMILKQANDAMVRLNVQPIDCLGEPFDPQQAEAVMHVEDDTVGPSTVVEILQKGYRCGDRVIRHCMVKVAN